MKNRTTITFKIGLLVSLSAVLSTLFLSAIYIITARQKAVDDILKNTLIFAEVNSQPIYQDYLISTGARFKSLLFDRMSKNTDIINISMIGYDGRIYFDSDELKKQTTSEQSDYVDIASSPGEFKFIENKETLKMVKSENVVHQKLIVNNQKYEEIVIPIKETLTSHIVSIRYLVSFESLNKRIDEIYLQTLIVIPLCLIFIIASIILSRTITKPINKLFLAFEEVQKGNYNVTLGGITTNDEIKHLSETFNTMVSSLKTIQTRQEEYQHNLESDVNKKSEELTQKVDELEALNKVMVGREMKMIELKNEITRLNAEITSLKEQLASKQ